MNWVPNTEASVMKLFAPPLPVAAPSVGRLVFVLLVPVLTKFSNAPPAFETTSIVNWP
jgi:hypothetical protein